MIDDQVVLRIERLRDEVESFKEALRAKYVKDRPVISPELRERAASIAERWLIEVTASLELVAAIGDTVVAERSVHFQRLLTYSERSTLRKKYDQSIAAILKDFRGSVVVPLKAHRNSAATVTPLAANPARALRSAKVVFVGESFADSDKGINSIVERFLRAMGLTVLTGEKPRADSVSKKVKERIDQSEVFVGVFTRRDKLEGKNEWTTSPWIIDEKAYALAKNKKLILMKEQGVSSIGGLQGDYEYLEFSRADTGDLLVRFLETYNSSD